MRRGGGMKTVIANGLALQGQSCRVDAQLE